MTRSPDRPIRKLLICVRHPFDQWNAPSWFAERLRREFPEIEVVHLPDYKRMDKEIVDAEILVAWSIRPEQIAAAKKLRWIHSPAAAVHQLIFPELVNSDLILTNAREVHGPVVAEHVIALIFALAKKIAGSVRLQEKHVWGQQILWDELPRVREVSGATVGMVGLGSIGRPVVKSAKALGMLVIAVREHPEKGSEGADAVDALPLPTEDGRLLLKLDEHGTLRTSSDPQSGHGRDDFFYYAGDHRTPLSNAGVCKGGMIWQIETMVDEPTSTPFARFFVGTEDQYRHAVDPSGKEPVCE